MSPSEEKQRIIEMIRETYSGDPWHGPSFRRALRGVDAARAAVRLPDLSHSIWELTLHVQGWLDVVSVRLGGRSCREPDGGDFPQPSESTAAAWRHTLEGCDRSVARLLELIERMPLRLLDERVPGKRHTYRPMLIGVSWHTLHHAGQISLIKRALRRREALATSGHKEL